MTPSSVIHSYYTNGAPIFRYLLSFTVVAFLICVFSMGVIFHIYLYIGVGAFLGFCCLFVILPRFGKIKVTDTGVRVPRLCIGSRLIPWISIRQIKQRDDFCYTIITHNTIDQALFHVGMERFDQFIEDLRSRGIRIESNEQHISLVKSPPPSSYSTSDKEHLLPNPFPAKLSPPHRYTLWLFPFIILICGTPLTSGFTIYNSIMSLVAMALLSCIIVLLALWTAEMAWNCYTKFTKDGIDFKKTMIPGRRTFVTWSDILYIRIFERTNRRTQQKVQNARFYAKGHDDFIFEVDTNWNLLSSVMNQLGNVPILTATEPYKGTGDV